MSSEVNLILCIINHTLVSGRRQLVVIDSLVKLIILTSHGFQFIITHGRQLLLRDTQCCCQSLHLVFLLNLNIMLVSIISIMPLRISVVNISLMLLLRSCWLISNLSCIHFSSLGNIVTTHLHQVHTIVNSSINLLLAHGISLTEDASQYTAHLLVGCIINLILDVCPVIAKKVLCITISHVHLITESIVLGTIVHALHWSGASTHRIHGTNRDSHTTNDVELLFSIKKVRELIISIQ